MSGPVGPDGGGVPSGPTVLSLRDGSEFDCWDLGAGSGGLPLVYLPGFPDLGSVSRQPLDIHRLLAAGRRLVVLLPRAADPATGGAFPGWRGLDDVVFRCLWALDELGLGRVDLAGHSIGGWLAAEMAAWAPERCGRLTLVSPAGLDLPERMVDDIFMKAQPRDGFHRGELRALLFADAEGSLATALFPDRPLEVEEEMRRFAVLRFAALIGWTPAYLYDWDLPQRLLRCRRPALVVNGREDRFLGPDYGRRFADALGAGQVIVAGAGHAVHLERPEDVAAAMEGFLARSAGR
jgi:pimeloyl-ACP methyl ester carboxylesterase